LGDDGSIVLAGDCPVEDAEPLLELLQKAPGARIDWTGCARLHTAVAQVILAAGRPTAGLCGDPWVRQWLSQG
jgi:hypothetical protein